MPKAFLATLPLLMLALIVIVLGIVFPDLFLFIPKALMPGAFL